MLEAWTEAELSESVRLAVMSAFGGSAELRLVEVLSRAQEPLQLSEISVRCGVSRNELLRTGRVRLALARMERSDVVVNLGTRQRPRYQLNLPNEEAKVLKSIFGPDDRPTWKSARPQV